jgi:hypothetical protein
VKHTPGPWSFSGQGDFSAIESDEREIAHVFYPEDMLSDEHKANTRLIAAAPELLASLTACVEWLDVFLEVTYGDDTKTVKAIIDNAKAAITEAKAP